MAEATIPVTPEEDEAWEALAERLAAKVAEHLREEHDARPLLTTDEVAARLNISPKSARDLVAWRNGKRPRLESIVIGEGARRVEQAALDAYMESRRAAQEQDLQRGPVARTRNPDLVRDHGVGEDRGPDA